MGGKSARQVKPTTGRGTRQPVLRHVVCGKPLHANCTAVKREPARKKFRAGFSYSSEAGASGKIWLRRDPQLRTASIGNAVIPDGSTIIAIDAATFAITINMATTAAISGSATLNFYNPGLAQAQSSQASAGQITNTLTGITNEFSIAYWEQGVIITPIVNTVGATYDFVFRP